LAVGFPLGKKVLLANFHEKALFVKADVAAPRVRAQRLRVLRAMLPSALSVSPFFCGSVHYGIRLFGLIEGAAIFLSVSAPREDGPSSLCAVALC
jgi:hypothetical protein